MNYIFVAAVVSVDAAAVVTVATIAAVAIALLAAAALAVVSVAAVAAAAAHCVNELGGVRILPVPKALPSCCCSTEQFLFFAIDL